MGGYKEASQVSYYSYKTDIGVALEVKLTKPKVLPIQFEPVVCNLGCLGILYYSDRLFIILEIFHAEMADKFSFDLRRI